jgi:hypothetical protein
MYANKPVFYNYPRVTQNELPSKNLFEGMYVFYFNYLSQLHILNNSLNNSFDIVLKRPPFNIAFQQIPVSSVSFERECSTRCVKLQSHTKGSGPGPLACWENEDFSKVLSCRKTGRNSREISTFRYPCSKR